MSLRNPLAFRTAAAVVLVLAATPALAVGLEGWGPRLGVGDDPDQAIVGWQIDLGEVTTSLRLRPSLEAGFGDDHTIASLTVPLLYEVRVASDVQPYVGGGARVAWIDRDERPGRRGDDDEVEIAPTFIGGIEWPLASGSDMFLELEVAGGDAHDARLLIGWQWRP